MRAIVVSGKTFKRRFFWLNLISVCEQKKRDKKERNNFKSDNLIENK